MAFQSSDSLPALHHYPAWSFDDFCRNIEQEFDIRQGPAF